MSCTSMVIDFLGGISPSEGMGTKAGLPLNSAGLLKAKRAG